MVILMKEIAGSWLAVTAVAAIEIMKSITMLLDECRGHFLF